MSKSKPILVKFHNELYVKAKEASEDTGSTVSSVIRQACEIHMEEVRVVGRVKKIIHETGYEDITRVHIPFNNGLTLYIRDKARAELEQLSEKARNEVMGFIKKNLEKRTLIEKGSVISRHAYNNNIILFEINKINVYCTYNKHQLIIYLVEF